MQGMLSNWKICFNVINIRTYDKKVYYWSQNNQKVMKITFTKFPILCQQTTKTALKCNTDLFGPLCQFWFVNLECLRDSKPQPCVQHHKSLKMTLNATNQKKT